MGEGGLAGRSTMDRDMEIIKAINSDTDNAVRIDAVLAALEVDEDVRIKIDARFYNTYGAHAFNLVIGSFTQNLIMILMRMHDKKGANRASLPSLFSMVDTPDGKEKIKRRARDWPASKWLGNEKVVLDSLEAGKHEHQKVREDWLINLREFRDHTIAHNLFDLRRDNYGNNEKINNVLKHTELVVRHMYLAVAGVDWDPKETRRVGYRYGLNYWRTIVGLEEIQFSAHFSDNISPV